MGWPVGVPVGRGGCDGCGKGTEVNAGDGSGVLPTPQLQPGGGPAPRMASLGGRGRGSAAVDGGRTDLDWLQRFLNRLLLAAGAGTVTSRSS
jgi:hypothetical protein